MPDVCYIRTHDGALLNAELVIEFRISKDERPESNPLSVAGNGYERGILTGLLPANGVGGFSIVALGWRHQLEALVVWLTEKIGRARLIDVEEFLRSKDWEDAKPSPHLSTVRPVEPPESV